MSCEPLPEQPPYRVTMLRRARLQGQLFRVGEIVTITGDTALRSAAGLVSTLQARPADQRTATAVELYLLMAQQRPGKRQATLVPPAPR